MRKKPGRKSMGMKMCKMLLNLPELYKTKAEQKAKRLQTSVSEVMRQAIITALKYEDVFDPVLETQAHDEPAQAMTYEEFLTQTYKA